MKKKTYSIGTGGVRFKDPIKFISKLTSTKKCVNEIRVPANRAEYCESHGFQILEDYYDLNPTQDSDEDDLQRAQGTRIYFPLPKKIARLHQGPVQVYHPPEPPKDNNAQSNFKKSPGKSANKFKFKEEVLSAVPSNSLFDLAIQGVVGTAASPTNPGAATENLQPGLPGYLGKRVPGSSPSIEEQQPEPPKQPPAPVLTIGTTSHPQRAKYLCPKTGIYFSTLEDYRLIRQLLAKEELLRAEKELKYLRAHTELKRRKLAQQLEEESHAA